MDKNFHISLLIIIISIIFTCYYFIFRNNNSNSENTTNVLPSSWLLGDEKIPQEIGIRARFLQDEGMIYQQLYYDHLPEPYNTEITKEYGKLEPRENTLGEKIRVLRAYLMRKCEEYRLQQKVKKDKKLGLREVCGFTEKRLVFGCKDEEEKESRHKRYI